MGKLSAAEKERRAQIRAHTCMCGCGKGCSSYKDEPTDANEKLDRQTLDEVRQQQQGIFACADPFEVLDYRERVQAGEIDPEDQENDEDWQQIQMS